ncbi:unnamed protein product [Sphacelaria rigidula]
MRVTGDEMGWNWMEQFLYWAKTSSQGGSAGGGGPGETPSAPLSPKAARKSGVGVGGQEGGAKGKRVTASFGSVAGGGMHETEEETKLR